MIALSPELQAALKIFSRFFDLIHQPLAIINHEGKYVYYNQESADLDGSTIEQSLGQHMLDVYPKMKESQSTMLTALKKGKEYIGHYQIYYNAKGQAVDYQHTTAPLYGSDGQLIGVIEIGRNLSGVRRLQEQVVELNHLLYAREREEKHDIITADSAMLALIDKGKKLAVNDVPVMIVGETGTGKELFARLIHRYSKRADKPFIALNCGALPPTLVESSLFGTVKGAFTGAENSQGYLELANGGTLFLDELNAMPVEIQSRLLRFLQDKTFWKIGGNRQLVSDVRIVAAINESPVSLQQQGKLRSDLFYRLSVGMLQIPPLSARTDDILLLAHYFLDKHRNDFSKEIHGVSDVAAEILLNHHWPGNVRMLENILVRSMIMQEHDGPLETIIFDDDGSDFFIQGEIKSEHSSESPVVIENLKQGNLACQMETIERQLISQSINQANGNISEAARLLGLSRTTLHYKIKKHNIRLGVMTV